MKPAFATALPRISLIGNPSDIYGGFGLGFPIWNWQAKVFLDTSISTTEEIPLLQATREVFFTTSYGQTKVWFEIHLRHSSASGFRRIQRSGDGGIESHGGSPWVSVDLEILG